MIMLTSLIDMLQATFPLIADLAIDPYYPDDNTPTLIILAASLIIAVAFFAIYAVASFFFMKIFAKANVPSWKAWVPVANLWKFFELGGYHGAFSLLFVANIFPFLGQAASIVGLVFLCMAAHQIGLKLGKENVWVLLFIFMAVIWLGIMAFGKSVWNDSLGKPALGVERPPSWPVYAGGVPPTPGYEPTPPPTGYAPSTPPPDYAHPPLSQGYAPPPSPPGPYPPQQ